MTVHTRRVSLLATIAMTLAVAHCKNTVNPNEIVVAPDRLDLAVGASQRVEILTGAAGTYSISGCDDVLAIDERETDRAFTVTATAAGQCTLRVAAIDESTSIPVTVVAPVDTETEICTVPVGKGEELEGRALYRTEVDLDALPGTCAVRTATVSTREQRLTIGFFSGSPGYSVNPRFDYRVLTAVPGEVSPTGSSANLTEGQKVDVTVGPREKPDAGPSVWSLRFRMNADPDPAKWTVTLYRFDKT